MAMIEPWTDAFFAVLSPVPLVIGIAAIAAAGFLRGFVGFGNSILIVVVFSLLYGPVFAVPFAALASLPPTIQLLPVTLREAERGFVLPFAVAVFAAAPFGALALVAVDPTVLKFAISAGVLLMVALLYRDWRPARPLGAGGLAGIGVGSGLAQGIAGAGGVLVAAAALSRPGSAGLQRANTIGGITAVGLCNFPPFLWHGLFTREVVILSVLLLPVYLAGTRVGARFFAGGGGRHYRNGALLVLAAVGLIGLGLSLRAWLAAQ